MIKVFLFIIINSTFWILNSHAQTPNWIWAKDIGGASDDEGRSIVSDANGNLYVTGSFGSSSIILGSDTLLNSNINTKDVFLVKYSSNGSVLWAKEFGGSHDDYGKSLAMDDSGNVYLTGSFKSSFITFGSVTLTINVNNEDDIFIVKFDSSGNVVWAKSNGGTGFDFVNSIAVDKDGNILVTGSFYSGSITFGSTTLTNATGNFEDFFLVKYDNSGNVIWGRTANCIDDIYGNSVTTDSSGNVYVTGSFGGPSATFGSITLTSSFTLYTDIFVVKYSKNGQAIWAKGAGGGQYDEGKSIASDANGNIYVTGRLNAIGNIFVIKYSTTGIALWTKNSGGTNDDSGDNLICDPFGNIYVTGYFKSSFISFGSIVLTNSSSDTSDFYVVKYDNSGNVLWAKSSGAEGFDYSRGIAADGNGNVYLTGGFNSSTIPFGIDTLGNTGINTYDIFVAKIGNNTTGIQDLFLTDRSPIVLYPNPAIHSLYFNNSKPIGIVQIVNAQGKVVETKTISTITFIWNLEELPAGIYIFKGETWTKKIIKG